MSLATKDRIVAAKQFSTERYIRSTHPVLYISGRKDFGGTNTFRTQDAYAHLAARTGALWTPQGYILGGVADYINCGSAAALSDLTTKTIIIWFKATGWGESDAGRLVAK